MGPHNADSQYGKQLARPERKFNPLKIPSALEGALPFKSRPKNDHKKKVNPMRKAAAVISNEQDRAVNKLLLRLHTIRKEKRRIRQESSKKKQAIKEKREKFIQDKRDAHNKETKKKRYIKEGHEEVRRRKVMKLD